MVCYYKEVFGLGVLASLFIFVMIILFWEGIDKFISKIKIV